MTDHTQIMGNKHECQLVFINKVGQQVQNLRPDRDIEGADGLVGDQDPRLADQGAGNRDALTLAAGELVRKASAASTGRPTAESISPTSLR